MIIDVSGHKRAHAFAEALEESSGPGVAGAHTDDAADATTGPRPLTELVGELQSLPRPTLDPEVKLTQRAQLMAAMEAMAQEGTAAAAGIPAPRTPGRHRAAGSLKAFRPRGRLSKSLAAGGITMGVAAGALGGVASASSDALPGDSLYGLKRGMEDLRIGFADNDADRGRLYLDHASTRLSEARQLMDRRDAGSRMDHESLAAVRRALSGVTHDASEGHRLLQDAYERDGSLGPMQTLNAFSRSHRESWSVLSEELPVQLGDVRDQVSGVFDAMDEDVAPLRSLFPEPDAKAPGGASDDSEPSSEASEESPSSSPEERPGKDSSGSPSPSDSTSAEEGLLGGGLLDPPDGEKGSPEPSGGQDRPAPEVTIPPLLPGLLPGLGLGAEDAD